MDITLQDIITVLHVLINSGLVSSYEKICLYKDINILEELDNLYVKYAEKTQEPEI